MRTGSPQRRPARVSERGKTSEPLAKRRLRSLKRETGGGHRAARKRRTA